MPAARTAWRPRQPRHSRPQGAVTAANRPIAAAAVGLGLRL